MSKIQKTKYGWIVKDICDPANQFNCNSCWAIATCQCVSDRLRLSGIIPPNDELNYYLFHDFIVANSHGRDSCERGAEIMLGMEEMERLGAPLLSLSKDRTFDERYSSKEMNQYKYKVKSWRKIQGPSLSSTVNAIKKELREGGTLITTINIYGSFMDHVGSSIYEVPNYEKADPNMVHMVSIVGYDDNDGTFIIRNSYGKEYGHYGLVKVRQYDTRLDLDLNCFAPILLSSY